MKKTVLFRTYRSSEASFPFDKTFAMGLLPVGNQPNLIRTIKLVKSLVGEVDIRVLVEDRLEDYRHALQDIEVQLFSDLEQAIAKVESLIILDVNYYFDAASLAKIMEAESNLVFVQEKNEQFKSIHGFGVKVDGNRLTKVYGHARDHYVDFLLAGAMVLDKAVLDQLTKTPLGMSELSTGGMPPQKLYLENVLTQALKKGIEIKFHKFDKLVLDISYPWHLLEANQLETKQKVEMKYQPQQVDTSSKVLGKLSMQEDSQIQYNCVVKDNVRIGKNTKIAHGVIIEDNVIIGDDCQINHYAYIAKNTVIGNGVKLGFHSEVGGLIMDYAAIVHQSEIYGVIGRYVDIGAGTLVGNLRFDDQNTAINVNGRRMSNQSTSMAFVGDYSRTGIGNIILPGVRIGSYCAIGPGVIMDQDAPHETLVMVNQEKVFKSWKPAKYNWK